jgi:hypothetical protein
MRKLWSAVLTPVLALAFFVVGSPAANAFGSEVLGCSVNPVTATYNAWTANSCAGGGDPGYFVVRFSPHNLSGTYSTSWTVTGPSGAVITSTCGGTAIPCIYNGCTLSSLTCDIKDSSGFVNKTYTASLRLTQSGLTRTIQAQGTIYLHDPCTRC